MVPLKPREGCLERLNNAARGLVVLQQRLWAGRTIVGFDIEATGELPTFDRIVEFGAAKIRPDGSTTVYGTLVNPMVSIPTESTAIHHITNEMVADAPRFVDLALGIACALSDAVLLGFNLRRFDVRILDAEFSRAGVPETLSIDGVSYPSAVAGRPILDPFSIYQERQRRDLAAAYREYCGAELDGAHGAGADVEASVDVLISQLTRHEDLPTDVDGLVAYCDRKRDGFVDRAGKFRWRGDRILVAFGKHTGRWLDEMDRGFLNWMLDPERDFEPDTLRVVRAVLNGEMIVRPPRAAQPVGEEVTV